MPSLDIDAIGTLRARAGFAIDRIILFGTGGVALASADGNEVHGGTNGGSSETHFGWVIGAGAEFAVTDDLLIRGEYLHSFFDSERYSFPLDAPPHP